MMRKPTTWALLGAALLLSSTAAQADWRDWMKKAQDTLKDNPQATQNLDKSQVVAGLREALANGSHNAITSLGQSNGFIDNAKAKIELPQPLNGLESKLRKLGLGQPLDNLSLSINQAATAAIPQAADIISAAIQALSIEDAMNILNGPDDAATRYFQKQTSDDLSERLRPLISQATDQAGVSAAYKTAASKAGPWIGMVAPGTQDLDGYVTTQTLQGLFTVLAEEEQKIRNDPAARSSALLKQVFGSQ